MRAEEKAAEEELLKKVDEMMKESLDEERRHMMNMEDIKRKREQELEEHKAKNEEDMKKLIERFAKLCQDYNATATPDVPYTVQLIRKYKDKNGEIHEFDAADRKQFAEVMKEKTNTLIFD